MDRCPGPVTRREFLCVGGLALGGVALADVLAARAATGEPNRQTSVILLFMNGGPSQLETYDLKPDAPSEYRSIYRPIVTNVPGMEICEHLPLHAAVADKLSLVRSLHHDVDIHSDGGITILTGKRPVKLDPSSGSKSEHPDFGAVASKLRGLGAATMPPYVAIPRKLDMLRPAYLGVQHRPFELADPANAASGSLELRLNAGNDGRVDDRKTLLQQLDRFRNDLDTGVNLEGTDRFRELAFQLIASPDVEKAFDISQESHALRDRYGRHSWGQSCLMARRLAEAGTSVITVYFDTPRDGQEFVNWDDHPGNNGRPGHFGRYMSARLPYFDQAVSALIEDVFARGLDKQILVVAMGEFGRTPRLNNGPNQTCGRDHWPSAYSALISGGGLKMGQVIGATNSKAEYPTERPLTPQDMLATIYRHLGIDYRQTFPDFAGRPVHILDEGAPIAELV